MNKISAIAITLLSTILLAGCGNAVITQTEDTNTPAPAVTQEVKDKNTVTPTEETANPNNVPTPTEETTNPSTEKTFTLTDISSHNSESDCWMAIDGKVYNVTEYVSMHNPAIVDGCGIDATSLFGSVGKHSSPQIQALLGQYFIGVLK
jgi:cytochrome b involved in lipid metabolism